MFTRIVMLIFIVTLALPVAALKRCGDTGQAPWSASDVAAKGTPRPTPAPVTQTFTSTALITIPASAPTAIDEGPANLYPCER